MTTERTPQGLILEGKEGETKNKQAHKKKSPPEYETRTEIISLSFVG